MSDEDDRKIGFNGVVGGQQRGEESAQYGDGEDR